ncbi:ATP-binding protein [Kineosporia sp. A_224]|uniref:sensor histidine kinase n=1 Tax=Kineosporia sp. A_224 TaxID=1962180 RepID=UPI000B4B1B7F|nr:ATP-binding protein [Kineosporia sp. A_224]
MLNRLQVREKLTLLVVVPLVAVALLLVPLLAGRLDVARSAGATARTATLARDAGVLVEGLQSVRLLAVAYLSVPDAAPGELTLAVADVEARRVALAQEARDAGQDDLAARLDGLAPVGELGRRVLAREATQDAVVTATSEAVGSVVDGLGLTAATGEGAGRLTALDTLLRADESSARSGVLVLVAATSTGARRQEALAAARDASASATALGSQFARLAPGAVAELFGQATGGPSAARLAASRAALERAGADRVADRAAVEVYGAVRSENAARQLVQTRVAQEVAVTASDAASAATLAVSVVAAVVVVLFLLVVALTVVVGRSVSRPLRRLTGAAGRVADLAQAELRRVADEDDAQDVTPRLAAVEVGTDDEIGELAEAFNRVQASAALLLQRQVVSRRNVATMFAGVGRRTSNLVGRQLSLIDRLERTEDDPDTLAMLYRLDHVSTRLRRNASSLVVLSGSTESSGESRPVAIADAVRGALGTVEEYQRVMIGRLPAVFLAPGAASDLVLLLAELMENAVLFSPPSSTVEVTAERSADGVCVLSVVDHGLGMSPDRFAVENARLKQRERLDLAPTDVLGLFVVGRIARRHGLDVRLEPTADQGVTAVVTLPPALLVDAPVLPPAQVESRRSRQQRPQTERVPVAAADAAPAAGGPRAQ